MSPLLYLSFKDDVECVALCPLTHNDVIVLVLHLKETTHFLWDVCANDLEKNDLAWERCVKWLSANLLHGVNDLRELNVIQGVQSPRPDR